MAHLFIILFPEYFKPTVEIYCSEKNDSFQNITVNGQGTWSLKSTDKENFLLLSDFILLSLLLLFLNIAILQSMNQGVILTFNLII